MSGTSIIAQIFISLKHNMSCAMFDSSHFDILLSVFEKLTKQ